MKKLLDENKDRILYGVLGIIGYLILMFVSRERGFFLQTDSALYINNTKAAAIMPIYPEFIKICSKLFETENDIYLYQVVFLQTVLAVVCTLKLLDYVRKHFNLELLSTVICYIALLLLWGIDYIYAGMSHQILTEALAYPLFYIYFMYVLKSLWEEEFYRNSACHMMWAFILSEIRSQMRMMILISALIFLYAIVRDVIRGKRSKKYAVIGLSSFAAIVLVTGGMVFASGRVDQLYDALTYRALYIMDRDDAELFDGEIKGIFERTYEACDQQQILYNYAQPGFFKWRSMLACSYTQLAMEDAWDDYSEANPGWEDSLGISRVKAEGIIGKKIALKHPARFLYVTGVFFVHGLMCNVCYENDEHYLLCYSIMVIMYLAFLVVSIILARSRQKNSDALELMLVTVIMGVILTAMVSLLLFTIRRYVCYTIGLFYMSGWICVREIYINGRQKSAKGIDNSTSV